MGVKKIRTEASGACTQHSQLPSDAYVLASPLRMAEADWSMKWTLGLSLILCLAGQMALGALHTKEPLVTTKHGILRGKQTHVGNITVRVFLGIPFSKPPVGARRFAPPEPPQPWNGIRDATVYPPSCLQESWGQITSMYLNTRKQYEWLHFSEDCLYLNVYTPVLAPGDPLLPVMVWFPGGAFLIGSASSYEGSELAAREKVVLVFLQYRLGILGFLSTGDSQARGNWGLLDQIAALHWVQQNIEVFGGDPDSVTLFGQSAGAMSVSGLLMSPLAQGLFHRAISQSGTAVLEVFISHDPLKAAKKIAHLAGCNYNNTRIMVECLRALSGNQVMHVSKKMAFFHANLQKDPKDIIWFLSPVVDGVVFPEDPVVLLTSGQVTPVPYLLGVNSVEFEWSLPFLMKIRLTPHANNKKYFTKVLWSTSTLLNITKEQIPLVVKEYLNGADGKYDWRTVRNHLMDLVGDATFVYSTLQAARYHRDAGFPVYLYEFKHHTSSGIIIKSRHDGADHGDELPYIFGSPFSKGSSIGEEKEFSLQMMKYWANFARNGDPNDRNLPYWPRFGKAEKYLQLDFDIRVGVKLKEKKMAFWTRLRQPVRT
ncbi:carboxylesterase 4A [Sigmodon hispidus]